MLVLLVKFRRDDKVKQIEVTKEPKHFSSWTDSSDSLDRDPTIFAALDASQSAIVYKCA